MAGHYFPVPSGNNLYKALTPKTLNVLHWWDIINITKERVLASHQGKQQGVQFNFNVFAELMGPTNL